MEISFTTTRHEAQVIAKIIKRAKRMGLWRDFDTVLDVTMDLSAAHANGCPMDFDRFLAADDFNFAHDYCGIARHINRNTGQLDGLFLPRCARKPVLRFDLAKAEG